MKISTKSNIAAVAKDWDRLRKEYKRSIAKGLNRAAYQIVNEDMSSIMDSGEIDRPTRFTKTGGGRSAARYIKATDRLLKAYVALKDRQAKYLAPMVFGLRAFPSGRAVPVKIDKNRFGNIANLRGGRKIRALLARKNVFAGTLGGVSGIFERVGGQLRMLIYFADKAYKYDARFDWHGGVRKAADKRLPHAMDDALNKVIAKYAGTYARKLL